MANRSSRRRRALVAPFVVTIAAAPACGGPGPAGGANEPGGAVGTTAGPPGDIGYDANPPQPRPTGPGRWVDQGGDVWHFVFDDGRVARKDAGAADCFVYPRAECIEKEREPGCYANFVECPLGAADGPSPWGAPPAPPTELPDDQ